MYTTSTSGLPAIFWIIYIPVIIFMVVCMWKIFVKAGQPGWACIVPFYNIYIYLKIIKKPGYWFLLFLIPIVNYIFIIWSVNLLSKRFGKDVGFTIGLLLLGIVFYPILAFGDAQYEGVEETSNDNLLDN